MLAASAFVADLSARRKVRVGGDEARAWLHALLTADVEGLPLGAAEPGLLLTPTGRIRAAVTVAAVSDDFLLVQDPEQPERIDALLAPYVLSSQVEIRDETDSHALLAVGGGPIPEVEGVDAFRPSCLGEGVGLLAPRSEAGRVRAVLGDLPELRPEEIEARRIRRGAARFPVDLTTDSLPHEADFGDAIDPEKGCYLGQEAVARVRNLGHPPWVVLALRASQSVSAGDPIIAEGADVGRITSASRSEHGSAFIGRVRWRARDERLTTPGGDVEVVGQAIGSP